MTLTERQIKALDWMLTVLIEQTAERAPGMQPDQAVEEICDITSIVELLPPGEVHSRLMPQCEEIRREHQVRLDQVLAEEAAVWSDEDRRSGELDGWLISGGTIERVDDPSSVIDGCNFRPAFDSDEEALMHVESEAAKGSVLHRKAIKEIATNGNYSVASQD